VKEFYLIKFQFQFGAINREQQTSNNHLNAKFQFQFGAINSDVGLMSC